MPGPYSELKETAKRQMGESKPRAVAFGALYFLISLVLSNLVYRLTGYQDYMTDFLKMSADVMQNGAEPYLVPYPQVNGAAFALSFLLVVMDVMMQFGMDSVCLSVSRGKSLAIWDLFDGFNHFGKVACLMLLRGLLVAIGLTLLIVPGVILRYCYRTAVFVMLDHPEMGVIQCLRESRRQNQGHKMELFGLDLSFILWLLISYIAYNVPNIWVTPFMGITLANWYNRHNGFAPKPDDSADL